MTSHYVDAYGSGLTLHLTEAKVRRFQAALAIQMSLLTGRRISEVLPLEEMTLANHLGHLGHGDSQVTERHARSSKRFGGTVKQLDALDLAELCSYYTADDTPESVVGARDRAASSSPFNRVYQDLSRVDALSAHLSALHAQLKDEI